MKKGLTLTIVQFLLLILLQRGFFGQAISYLSIDQGLSNNSVRSIYKDSKGFMWFGTYDGLNRYDGYEFKVFRNNFGDSNSLAGNFVSVITEDLNNNMWFGTRKGANVYNPLTGRFNTISYTGQTDKLTHRLDDVVKDIKTDSRSNIFIATEGTGLFLCRPASLQAIQVPVVENTGPANYTFGVQSISIGNNNDDAWFFVQGMGICRLDYKKMQLRPVNKTITNANCMSADGDSIWIGAGNKLFNFQTKKNQLKNIAGDNNDSLAGFPIVSIKMDSQKILWIGTNGGGVYLWNSITRKIDRTFSGGGESKLSGSAVYAIYEDNEKRKWIGILRGGINIIDPQKEKFKTIAAETGNNHSLSGNYISAFCETGNALWVGTDGSGLNISKNKNDSFIRYMHAVKDSNSLPNDNITSINEDAEHRIWVATFWNGVARLNPATGKFVRYKIINTKTGIENKVVYCLYTDRSGILWATALRQGNVYGALYVYSKSQDRFELFDDALSDLFTLKEDRDGNLWGGNLSHIVKIDRQNKRHQFFDIGQPVRAIQTDGNGNLWLGTEGGGLVLFDRQQGKIAARFTTKDGLCSNSVISILNDGKESIWLGTNNGLSRFDIAKKSFKNYYQTDGLQSNQFIFNAAIKLKSGAFAFGGIRGYSIFFPNEVVKHAMASPLTITNIQIAGLPVQNNFRFIKKVENNEVKSLEVPYNQAILSFGFAALEYSSPANISYAYYMDGWDKEWNYSKSVRNAVYTNLPEGHYVFRVKNTNPDGVWNKQEVAIYVTVLPPWFRSWWAWLMYATIITALIYYYITYKNRQAKLRYEVKVAHLETENERARLNFEIKLAQFETEKEREQNEKRLSFFTNISHEFRTPLTLIINPIKEILHGKTQQKHNAQDLGTVYRNAKRLLSLVDQLLLFRKAESGGDKLRIVKLNFYNLCSEVYLCFVQQAKAKEIDYDFCCDNTLLELFADREKMEIILYNLISNALKYTPRNGKVTFEIKEEQDTVTVLVKDNGAGIAPEVGERLFEKFYRADSNATRKQQGFGIGLFLVKLFTEEHKGGISYKSEVGKGTGFSLVLLKGNGHFNKSVIFEDALEVENEQDREIMDELIEKKQPDTSLAKPFKNMVTDKKSILLVDDDEEIRKYMTSVFEDTYIVYESGNGEHGLKMAKEYQPDLIISDIKMAGLSGIDLCKTIKDDPALSHIPVVLLTGTSSEELKLEGIRGGADDYVTKPFDKELLLARVINLLKNKNSLQQYFYNEITLNKQNLKISAEYREFLDRCIEIVESHFNDPQFNIKMLASKIGMSHSVVYRKIKAVSGQTLNGFIRFIRLRKAARLFIDTTYPVNDVAEQVGMYDLKHFRDNFNKLFGMNPSEYIKKYRSPFAGKFNIDKKALEEHGPIPDEEV